jgi:hypothetical protein
MFSALRSLFKGSRKRTASPQTSRAKQEPDPEPDPELVEIDALIAQLREEVTQKRNKEQKEREWWGKDTEDNISEKLRRNVRNAETALSNALKHREEMLKGRKRRAHGGRRRYTRKRKGIRR